MKSKCFAIFLPTDQSMCGNQSEMVGNKFQAEVEKKDLMIKN